MIQAFNEFHQASFRPLPNQQNIVDVTKPQMDILNVLGGVGKKYLPLPQSQEQISILGHTIRPHRCSLEL